MKAIEAAKAIFAAVGKGKISPAFSEEENRWGASGASLRDGVLTYTAYSVYVKGGRLPTYTAWSGTVEMLAEKLRQHPYLPGLLQFVPGHIVGHTLE